MNEHEIQELLLGRHLTRRQALQMGLATAATISLAAACGPGTNNVAQSSPSPKIGGRIRGGFAGGGQSETLSPIGAWANAFTGDLTRTVNIYDTLVNFGPPGGAEVDFRLAQSMTPNADAKIWRVVLRSNATWHDGKPLTSKDALFSIKTMLDPQIGSQWVSLLTMVDLSSTRAVSDTEFDIGCNRTTADLPLRFAGMPVFQDGVTDFSKKAIGTGPFKLVSFSPGEGSLLQRNPDWWDKSGGPYLDEVQLRSIPDGSARLNALTGGELDYITDLGYVQCAPYKNNPSYRIVGVPQGNNVMLKVRVDKPPFNDPKVVQAFKLMVDRQAMLEKAFLGFGAIGNDSFGAGNFDFNTALATPPHDPDKARQLLREAGKENLTVTLNTSDAVPGMFESASIFVGQAKQAGVTVNLNKVPADQYFNPFDRFVGWEFASTVWSQSWPIVSVIQVGFLKSSNFPETGWFRPDFDAKFEQAVTTTDRSMRKRLLDELQQTLQAEDGHIMYVRGDAVILASSRVNNLQPLPFSRTQGQGDFSKVFLA